MKTLNSLVIDFSDPTFLYRLKTTGKNQTLSKALGIPKGFRDILDATGGLGQDALVIAKLGANVRLVERNEVVAEALLSGLEKAAKEKLLSEIISKVKLIKRDAIDYLGALAKEEMPEVIYLDPMYPRDRKSALPRKEMQILEELVGEDADQERLLEVALKSARHRVVVKRPKNAPPLLRPPDYSFSGTTTRYDLYLTSP